MGKNYKYIYTFATGETITLSEVDLAEEWYFILKEMDIEEQRLNRKETRRHTSLYAYDPFECILASRRDGFDDYEYRELWKEIHGTLTRREREVANRYYVDGYTAEEIAGCLGLTTRRVQQIIKGTKNKMKYFFSK